MVRFITASFVMLGWVFYEMSGGAGFAPPEAVPAPRLAHALPEGARAPIGAAEASPAAPASAPAPVVPAPVVPAGRRVVTAPSEFDPRAAAPPAAPRTTPRPAPRPAAGRGAASASAAERRTVAGSRVNMRGGPGTRHRVTHVLSLGEAAEILAVEGGWARVRSDRREGWVALSLLSAAD